MIAVAAFAVSALKPGFARDELTSLKRLYEMNRLELRGLVQCRLPVREVQASYCWLQLSVLHRHYPDLFLDPAVLLFQR